METHVQDDTQRWFELAKRIKKRIDVRFGSESAAAKALEFWDQATINRTLKIKENDLTPSRIRNLRLLAFDVGLVEVSGAEEESTTSTGLREAGRNSCVRLVGPNGEVLASLDMVLMGVTQPLQVPITLGVEGGEVGGG